MAKKRNYDDFIKFARSHKKLTRTEIYWAYREAGGKIKKQTALDQLRELTKVKKRKSRGKTVGKLIKEKKTRQRVDLPLKKDHDYKSLESPIIQKLYDNIQELYDLDDDQRKFLKVGIKNINDTYSTVKDFSIFIPTETDRMGVRKLSDQIIKNMKTYYKNLAKKYNTKANMVGSTLTALSKLTKEMKAVKYPTKEEMENVFFKNGFDITGYEIFEFRDSVD